MLYDCGCHVNRLGYQCCGSCSGMADFRRKRASPPAAPQSCHGTDGTRRTARATRGGWDARGGKGHAGQHERYGNSSAAAPFRCFAASRVRKLPCRRFARPINTHQSSQTKSNRRRFRRRSQSRLHLPLCDNTPNQSRMAGRPWHAAGAVPCCVPERTVASSWWKGARRGCFSDGYCLS